MIQEFIKKPVKIQAIQFNNINREEVEEFVGKKLTQELESETAYVAGKGAPIFSIAIDTKEGIMKAFPGDWIIKEPFPTGDRDFYPCKNDIFKKTYDNLSNNMDESDMRPEDLKFGQIVYHNELYWGRESMKIVGIRETEVELEGDYSGGTHAVCQKSWMPIKGLLLYKQEKNKTC